VRCRCLVGLVGRFGTASGDLDSTEVNEEEEDGNTSIEKCLKC
jgi:hypothetical protein